jgi:glycosyltransferase involved in cell wall biosynthesis
MLKVGFVIDGFLGWTGGCVYAGNMVESIAFAESTFKSHSSNELFVLVSDKWLGFDLDSMSTSVGVIELKNFASTGMLSLFIEHIHHVDKIFVYKELSTAVATLGLNIIGISSADLGSSFAVPWIGFITDFQHQYLPEYFSANERLARDISFRSMIENSSAMLVGSHAVVDDVYRFYPGVADNKMILETPSIIKPFPAGWKNNPKSTLVKFGLSTNYVISCSQRWVHKNHDVIISAYQKFRVINPNIPCRLVFTGSIDDYRDPTYKVKIESLIQGSGIANEIVHTGVVTRSELLDLIASSSALVHASSFEGGAGSSGVIEAAVLGVPILCSNLRVNKELDFGRFQFFSPRDVEGLAALFAKLCFPSPAKPIFDARQVEALKIAYGLRLMGSIKSVFGNLSPAHEN